MSEDQFERAIFGAEEPRRRRRRFRRRHAHRWLVLLVVIGLVGAAAVAAWGVVRPMVSSVSGLGGSEESDYPGPGAGTVTVRVHEGDTGETIATTLKDAGVVRTRAAYLEASNADPESTSLIQPGTYQLKQQMRGLAAFEALTDPTNRTHKGVTVPEGLWATETFKRLSAGTGVPLAQYAKAAKDSTAIGLPAAAGGRVEGWLFPATYEFGENATATEQLGAMVDKTVAVLDDVGVPAGKRQRTLNVASIVEAEARLPEDRSKVARVIENRLRTKAGPTNGRLQMDSTVHYAVQKRGKVGTSDADRASPSPYNTYLVKGLPPGPINSPGRASIEAAVAPADGPWLFFVTVDPDTGETKFSTTAKQHDRHVKEFRTWCSANKDKC